MGRKKNPTKYSDEFYDNVMATDPDRAFYLRYEDRLVALGVDLSLDNWDSVVIGDMVPMDGENRYSYLRRSLMEGGVLVSDKRGTVTRVVYDEKRKNFVAKFLVDKNEDIPEFAEPEPEEPDGPGFGAFLLRLITFGFYKPAAYKKYDEDMAKYNADLAAYEAAKEEFDERMRQQYRAETVAREKYNAALAARGKTKEMQNEYFAQWDKHKEHIARFSGYETTLDDIENAKERLDFIFGPKVSPEEKERMIAACKKQEIFDPDSFGEPQAGDKHPRLKDVTLPEGCPFDAHRFAILGYAASCSRDLLLQSYKQPDPDKPPVHEEISDDIATMKTGMWYNWVDGIATRAHRKASGSEPLINYAKSAALSAIEKYMEGDAADLGKIICQGIRWSVDQVTIQSSVTDNCSLADHGRICGELLGLVDREKNPQLYDAVIAAGLTEKDIENAKICTNLSKVWDAGINAMALLACGVNADESELTYEQKLSAAADVAGLRMAQQIIAQRCSEMEELPEYKALTKEKFNAYEAALAESKAAQKAMNDAVRDNAPNARELTAVYEAKNLIVSQKSVAYNFLNLAFILRPLGIDVAPNEAMTGTFANDTRPQEIHSMFANSDSIRELCKRPAGEVFNELMPTNAGKYVNAAMPRPQNPQPVVGQPAAQPQAAAGMVI